MTTAAPRRLPPWVVLVVGVGVLALTWALARPDAEVSGAAVPVRSPSAAATAGISDVAPTPSSGLPTVAESALPAEAATTLALIRGAARTPTRRTTTRRGGDPPPRTPRRLRRPGRRLGRGGPEEHVVRAGPPKAATLEAFAEELDLPAWSGANLDALAYGLGYVARTADHDRELVLDGVPTLVSRHGGRALTMDS